MAPQLTTLFLNPRVLLNNSTVHHGLPMLFEMSNNFVSGVFNVST